MTEIVALDEGAAWRVDDVRFTYRFDPSESASHFSIRKSPDLLAKYGELCREFAGARIVELGIADGGSAALLSLLARPRKLVACELAAEPIPALADFIDERGLAEVVRPFYGVDQADRVRLTEIVERELGGEPLDLVVDDASHLHDETRASFEVLFPRLRPGGLFVVEDWAADYVFAKRVVAVMEDRTAPGFAEHERRLTEAVAEQAAGRAPTPLPRFGVELMQICAQADDVVREVTIDQHWLAVRRGPAALDPAAFRLTDHYRDYWGWTPA